MQSQYMQDVSSPADPRRFLEMTQVFQRAALASRSTSSSTDDEPSDAPFFSGMQAVVREMRDHGDSEQALRTTTMRLMHLDEIFDSREFFAEFIRPGTDGADSVDVDDVLMMAVAVARILPMGRDGCFDLVDVLAHAKRFAAAQDQELEV